METNERELTAARWKSLSVLLEPRDLPFNLDLPAEQIHEGLAGHIIVHDLHEQPAIIEQLNCQRRASLRAMAAASRSQRKRDSPGQISSHDYWPESVQEQSPQPLASSG